MLRRLFTTTATHHMKQMQETVRGKTIEIRGVNVESERANHTIENDNRDESCVLCRLDLKLKYSDVLILEQFMRKDGTVLPMEVTGLCAEQQEIMENCVLQAHWSGLFPNHKPKDYNEIIEAGEWRRYKRYWTEPKQLFDKTLKQLPGSWFYVRRY